MREVCSKISFTFSVVRPALQNQSTMHHERWHPYNVPRCSVYLKYTEVPRKKGGEEGERGAGERERESETTWFKFETTCRVF